MSIARDVEAVERAVWQDMYAAAPDAFRDAAGLSARRFDGALALAAARIPDTQFNRAFGFGVDAAASEAELDAVIAHMRVAGAPKWWLQPSPEAGDLIAAIEARGFARMPRSWVKMARDPVSARHVDTELGVAEIGAAQGDALSGVLCAAFDAPAALGAWFKALIGRPHWRFYLASENAHAVAGAALWCDGEAAWLGMAGTDPSARRRGGQGVLMARRIEDARSLGARVIITETGEKSPGTPSPSYDNMIRHGFTVVHVRANYASPATD